MIEVVLERKTFNKINPENTENILKRVAAVLKERRHLGVLAKFAGLSEPERVFEGGDENYRYLAKLKLKDLCQESPELAPARYRKALELLTRAAHGCGWQVLAERETSSSLSNTSPPTAPPPAAKPPFRPPALTEEVMRTVFSPLFEREAHVRVMHSGVEHFSQGGRAAHFLLGGDPGAAKTLLIECFQKWYNQDGHERLHILYGTSTSKAGLENWLLKKADRNELPDILAIEEIEKQDKKNLDCLLSVMASGFVDKTTAPMGHVRRETPLLIWATCNDVDELKAHRKGALYSRFEELPCARPTREDTYKILLNEVGRLNGDPRWAEAALLFGWDERGERDPRKIVGLLKGRDRLLDGSYQKDLLDIYNSVRRDDARRAVSAANPVQVFTS